MDGCETTKSPVCLGTDDHRVFCGDCRELIRETGRRYNLIFADPPFGIGQKYNGFKDKFDNLEEFTETWVRQCCLAVTKGGILALHGPDDLADIYLHIARKLGIANKRIAWVNWSYRFGQCSRRNWIDARCHCLVYAANPDDYTWNPEEVLIQSDRVAYGDKRIHETERGGKRLPGTVWGVAGDGKYWGRVQGTNAERIESSPNQLPEVYLARLIKAYTNPGDTILDPFCGSGTTIAVAKALGRKCDTIDVSMQTCEAAARRLQKGAVRV